MLAAAEASLSSSPTLRPPAVHDDPGSMPDVQGEETGGGASDALGVDAIPFVSMSAADLAWFDLSPLAAKLLACVDGVSSLEAICAAANVTADEGAAMLLDLAVWRVISFR
jgi:hypothetical protein